MGGRHPSAGRTDSAPEKTLTSRVVAPFVGRDKELGRLVAALSLAAGGKGRTIFLTGQSGIGKTRLAREALALAKDRGFMVLEGRAYPLEAGMAYAPIVDAIGPILRSYDSLHLQVLTSDLPSLGRIFEGFQLPAPSFPSEGLNDAALEKTRLFEAVACLLKRLTQKAPVVVLLDDLHWADPASLEMLHYLARGLPDERALLLATYNGDAACASGGLRALLESLKRHSLSDEIILPCLQIEAVGRVARGVLQGEVPDDLLALLDARAGGVPLFVEALLAALVDSGDLVRSGSERNAWVFSGEGAIDLPQNVRSLALERLNRLTLPERRIFDLIAVFGDATPHAVLCGASGLEEETLLDVLRRLRAAGLVADGTDGLEVVYNITHPLIQEVAYSELPVMERRRSHAAAIRALEALSEGQPSDARRLARHYLGAGPEADPGRALSVLVAAGDRALNLYANEEAVRHFEAALALLRKGRGIPSTLSTVLERLGEAWERTGKPGAAIKVWHEALANREQAGEARDAARLRRCLALAEWDCGHIEIANAHLEAGLAILGEGETGRGLPGKDCQELADLYFARCHILIRLGDTASVGEIAGRLLDIAERLASPRARAEANLAVANSALAQGDVNEVRQRAMQVLETAEQAGDLAMCCRAHALLAGSCLHLGDHRLMRHHAERGLAVVRRLGAPSVEVVFRARQAYADFMTGAWDESLRNSLEAVMLARRVGYPRTLAHALAERAMILALQGDFSEASSCLAEARTALNRPSTKGPADVPVVGLIDIVETALALERDQAEQALGIARGFLSSLTQSMAPTGLPLAFRPVGLTLLAEAQIAARDPESALKTAQKISALAPAGNQYVGALASRVEGLARKASGQREAAKACFDRAYEKFVALAMPFEAARCLLEQAEIGDRDQELLEAGTPDPCPLSPIEAARQSLAIFDRLGAWRYADRARQLLRELGIAPPRSRSAHPNGELLTARELEIARLVAEGLTTPEIAKRLILSPRTVSNHLDHIYARLVIDSRAALARYMTEASLLKSKIV